MAVFRELSKNGLKSSFGSFLKKLENFLKFGSGFGPKFGQIRDIFTRHDIATSKINIFYFCISHPVQHDQIYRKM